MAESNPITRRDFLNQSVVAAAATAAVSATAGKASAADAPPAAAPTPAPTATAAAMPYGMIGKVKLSRLLLGGNLVGGFMHCRDLHYVNSLFKAYVTEEKMMQTIALADKCGINTVFETGANFVEKYNREHNGHMQFIPHIQVSAEQKEQELKDHIKKQVDSGACALYVWGISADSLMMANRVDLLAKAVELAKVHGLPVGVGTHSLLVPMACEKEKVPVDFYVKTLHNDTYPSATPKELRKEFIWMTGGKGWYDNMWCINPEETIEFMKGVEKPWIAFKILAAGAYRPDEGFSYAFKNGADFVAVGMFDFQVLEDCRVTTKYVKEHQQRARAWRG